MIAAVTTACLVCGAPSGAPAYRFDGPASVTSTARTVALPTVVFVCDTCAHVQTPPLDDLARYYDSAYNVRLESDDADDLYAVRDGVPVYRTGHQANVALDTLALAHGASVLEYGCGKALTLRRILQVRPDLDGAVFDVSDAYRAAWDAFVPAHNQAAHQPPAAWHGRFDAVLSFFALEHAGDPHAFLTTIRRLLRPGGELFLTVPNVRRNAGDFIVVDHVNHFMPSSLHRILTATGFAHIEIDENAHESAYAVRARRGVPAEAHGEPAYDHAGSAVELEREMDAAGTGMHVAETARYAAEARDLAVFWSAAGDAVAAFERDVARGRKSAIYGSGFYGVFIASRLSDRSNLACFLDRNPHQQAQRPFDRPVVPPDALGDDVAVVYAGLNPARARAIVAGVAALQARPRDFFFL
jgi:SAM-dependent methyltransferase